MAAADNTQPVSDAIRAPLGYVQIVAATLASAVGIVNGTNVAPIPAGVKRMVMQAEVANVRWRDDGVDPTAAVGMILAAGDIVEYTGNVAAIKFIAVSGSPLVNLSFYN